MRNANHLQRLPYTTIALRNSTLGCFIVGRASRLPWNGLRSQAGRPRHFRNVQKRTSFGITDIALKLEFPAILLLFTS
jgi:hypothetical protein